MHARQRSPGNGYRSGSMGVGLAGSSFYASEYRRDNGFGRGHDNPKSFPPPPYRKGDIFMEAGRLAAEYLVSQGLLPPNALSIKSQNASFKKHSVELQDGDSLEGRTSALARLGNPLPDRRKFGIDHFSQKLRRRGASFTSNGSASDWGRDFKRTASWSDKLRASPDIKDNDDVITRHHEHRQQQQQVGSGVDNISQKSNSNESAPRTEDVSDLDTETDKALVYNEMDLPASTSSAAKDTYTEGVEFIKSSNDLGNTIANKELKDITSDEVEKPKPSVSNNFSTLPSARGSQTSSSVCTDLLTLCKSVKVPTRTRSSLTHKGSKADPLRNNGDESTTYMGCLQGPDILAVNESGKGSSSGISLTGKAYDHLDFENNIVQSVHSAENVKELDAKSNAVEGASLKSQSCQDKADIYDNQESDTRLAEYGSCGSNVEGRGEKRAAEADDPKDDTKKLREWLPPVVPKTEDYFLLNNSVVKKESSGEDEDSPGDRVTLASDHGSLMSNPQITQGGNGLFLQYSEEKQPLPSSFRTCDLNLIEASEIHENDEDDPILMFPSVPESNKGATAIDIDLSISHTTVSGEFSNRMTGGKDIEVIDLENDSVQEKSINNVERKTEAVFPGLEGFPNHAQNTSDIHDVQDGYGLMISDLLGSDFPNCSSVAGDINSVHNEMGLHNGTGALGEDDSIYMSLGEIPLSYLRTWEQPPSQDYEKPF